MHLIVLDTETSDLDPDKGAKLLEVSWIELAFNETSWATVGTYEKYIQAHNVVINPHAQAVHHIKPEMLKEENGAVARTDMIQFLQKCIGPKTIMVAHNAQFDSKFFPEINRPWICTYRAARHVFPGAPGFSNQVLRYWLGLTPKVENRYPHQAFYDVATTVEILLKMLQTYTPEQLLMFSSKPIRLKTIEFGKHRGTPFENLPRDYVQWLRGQSNLNPDLQHTLDSILKS